MSAFAKNLLSLSMLLPLISTNAVLAADPEKVRFDSYDGVELDGRFYPSDKGNKGPCAILLHPVGSSIQQEGWMELAKKLHSKGFAVLAFDFRGHGNSTGVKPIFWREPANQSVKRSRNKDQISYKDFPTATTHATMVNDIAAAKRFLDFRNDNGECNSANVVLIGAESSAALGALYLRAAFDRPRITVGIPQISGLNAFEGQDYVGAVWLSPSNYIGSNNRFPVGMDRQLGSPVKDRVSMLYLYGADDKKSETLSKRLYSETKPKKSSSTSAKSGITMEKAVPGTKLAGIELLGKGTSKVDEDIMKFVTSVVDEKGNNPYTRRETDKIRFLPIAAANYLNR